MWPEKKKKERKKFRTTPFTIASKYIKYVVNDLMTYIQHLYTKNYKISLREIKDLNKWRGRRWKGKLNTGNMSIFPKEIETWDVSQS